MNSLGYWQRKLSRRRVLATGGAAGTGLFALTLIGCGGGGSSESTKVSSSRITKLENTSSQAKRGGVYQGIVNADEASWDPLTASRTPDAFQMAYSRLVKQKESVGPSDDEAYEGDIAESWELAPDFTRITLKLRQDAKWDSRPPTNSRVVEADDIVYSWNKWETAGPTSQELAYKRSPAAPIETVQKIDNRTVAFKLAYPWSPLIAVMATGGFFIQPREAEDKFNPKQEIRASGTWYLAEYQPSAVMRWRKNPNWYRKDVPYMDGYDTPIITEYAARLAQFKAKNVWDLTPNAPDLVDIAKSMSEVNLYEGPRGQQVWHIDMGARPASPFADRRVRQAISMAIDRDLFAQVHSENDSLSGAGLPRSLSLCTIISDYWGDVWLDPKGNKLGEGGKYYQKNLPESKKLLQAAGYADGLDIALNSRGGADPGEQILSGMLSEVGIRSKVTSWTSPNYLTQVAYPYDGVLGNYEGWAVRGSVGFNPSLMSFLQKMWHTQGRNPGARKFDGDEQVKIDKLVDEGLRTFDDKKVRDLVWEMQRLHAVHLSSVPFWYNSNPLSVAWPWVKNRNVFQYREGNSALLHVWIDETKKA